MKKLEESVKEIIIEAKYKQLDKSSFVYWIEDEEMYKQNPWKKIGGTEKLETVPAKTWKLVYLAISEDVVNDDNPTLNWEPTWYIVDKSFKSSRRFPALISM